MTGLNEARPVIHTCIAIMQEISEKDQRASFGFVGSNMKGETVDYTKRFKIYSRMMVTYFSEEVFEHFMLVSKSAYLLIRKSELAIHPDLLHDLNTGFKRLYDYFE